MLVGTMEDRQTEDVSVEGVLGEVVFASLKTRAPQSSYTPKLTTASIGMKTRLNSKRSENVF